MEEIFIWGAGEMCNEVLEAIAVNRIPYQNNIFKIKGIIDNNVLKYGKNINGLMILSPGQAIEMGFDKIVVVCQKSYEIFHQLIYGYHISANQVKERWYLLSLLYKFKYQNDQDTEIRNILKYWDKKDITLFNNVLPETKSYDEVIWDRNLNLPYINFKTITGCNRRMYYPRDWKFEIRDGRQVVADVLYEQQKKSPHLYTFDNHDVKEGDVIMDAGVCEGNFALRYVDICSEVYLVENDIRWREPHYYTFSNKNIHFCYKGLTDRVGRITDTIDNIVKDKLDFLKMDIEGFEIAALLGGKYTMRTNNVKCSICCYHKSTDNIRLKEILKAYGYKTNTSSGYMTFLWDEDIWRTLDFRRGIVYGEKEN